MTTKTTYALLCASLIAILILPIGVYSAFAEASDEIKAKALEGKKIWEKLEQLKTKSTKNASEIEQEKNLQDKFDEIVKEMNKHGIATQEQWNENPQYWRSVNLPPIPNSVENNSIHSNNQIDLQAGDVLETMSHCGSCGTQELYTIAGFDYLLWGFWPTSAYSQNGWITLTYNGDEDTTTVVLEDDHDEITPHITQSIKREGTVNYDYGYDARIYGNYIDSNNAYGIQAIQVDPDSLAITEDELTNVVEDTIISYDVEVNWMD